ncbi:hypothetical protein IAQ61_002003 [Plenodomus lingam]|uniref:uncharacterized protein n=1 Tax=Leptosphaeria maculans TaxID=5022 RepID=UPI00331EA665|nr:hypothetical protein IAQ61_002003 [Plenodomus lingam]
MPTTHNPSPTLTKRHPTNPSQNPHAPTSTKKPQENQEEHSEITYPRSKAETPRTWSYFPSCWITSTTLPLLLAYLYTISIRDLQAKYRSWSSIAWRVKSYPIPKAPDLPPTTP